MMSSSAALICLDVSSCVCAAVSDEIDGTPDVVTILFMPLVVICGRPCTGKTTLAQQLAEFIRAKGNEVELVNAESLLFDRDSGFRGEVL